jgi:hypothetical protein
MPIGTSGEILQSRSHPLDRPTIYRERPASAVAGPYIPAEVRPARSRVSHLRDGRPFAVSSKNSVGLMAAFSR